MKKPYKKEHKKFKTKKEAEAFAYAFEYINDTMFEAVVFPEKRLGGYIVTIYIQDEIK